MGRVRTINAFVFLFLMSVAVLTILSFVFSNRPVQHFSTVDELHALQSRRVISVTSNFGQADHDEGRLTDESGSVHDKLTAIDINMAGKIDGNKAEEDVDTVEYAQQNMDSFKRALPEKTRIDFSTLLKGFDRLMTKANLTYFLYGGSLLGAYRFRDMIPWDDDLDIVIMFNEINRVQVALEIDGFHLVFGKHKGSMKFYHDSIGKPVHASQEEGFAEYERRYPDLDLFMFTENQTHVWDMFYAIGSRKYTFRKSIVYPLKRIKFGDVLTRVPKNVKTVLSDTYDLEYCVTNSFDHMTNEALYPVEVRCDELKGQYKFYDYE